LLPENRPAPSTLPQKVIPRFCRGRGESIHFENGQRSAAEARWLRGLTPPGKPCPRGQTRAVLGLTVFFEEFTSPAPTNVQGRVESRLGARPDDGVRRGITVDFDGPKTTEHGCLPSAERGWLSPRMNRPAAHPKLLTCPAKALVPPATRTGYNPRPDCRQRPTFGRHAAECPSMLGVGNCGQRLERPMRPRPSVHAGRLRESARLHGHFAYTWLRPFPCPILRITKPYSP
jgi:hypothetical protein